MPAAMVYVRDVFSSLAFYECSSSSTSSTQKAPPPNKLLARKTVRRRLVGDSHPDMPRMAQTALSYGTDKRNGVTRHVPFGHLLVTVTGARPKTTRLGMRRAGPAAVVRYASSTIVTGPSFTSPTCIRAPKTPVSTGTPRARNAVQNAA